MAFVLKDRVLETCTSPGTGTVTLQGAVGGYQTFGAAIGNANTTYYTIADQAGANWEVGIGTYTSAGNTLARTTVLASSNAGALVNFSTGNQNVFGDYPANRAVFVDSANTTLQPSGLNASFANLTATGTTTLATSLNGLLKTASGVVSAAVAGTDYAPATIGSSILYANGAGGFNSVVIGSNLTFAGGTLSATGGGGGSGTVTSVSVVSANGFAGTVATADTTPAITLSTTITGLLKGNGTAISAAVANTDYLSPTTPALAGETYSTATAIVAGTNAQGQGPLTADFNVIGTAATNPSGVTLPTATVGRRVIIVNKGANPITVYPATGAILDALAANAAITVPVSGWIEFNASSATQWYSTKNAVLPVTNGLGTGLLKNTTATGVLSIAVANTDYLAATTPPLASETYSTTAAVTAGTNAQGQGAMTTDTNYVTTTAANPSGVTLPTATVGRRIIVLNRGTNPINVYPAASAAIDGQAINLPVTIQPRGRLWFIASATTAWWTDSVLSGENYSTSDAVTAGTNAQGQGALLSDFNVVTTAANNPSGVTLPTATVGRRIIINNRGANPIAVFPATGAQIDALGANLAFTIAVNSSMMFNASSTTQWYSSTVAGAGAGTVTNVSVAAANGFSGSVATSTSTPVITLSTSASGILYGNAGTLTPVTIGSGLSFAAGTLAATGGGGGSLGPMMSYTMVNTQSIPANSTTVVLWNTIDFDTTSAYSATTGRFTPTVAGYYQVNWGLASNGTVGEQSFQLFKNGTIYHWGIHFATSSYWCMSGGSLAIYLNGTTDYIDTRWYNNSGAIISVNPNNTVPGRFTATYIGPAPTAAGSGLYSGLLVTPPVLASWTQMNISAPATVGNSAVGPIITDQFGAGPRVRGLYKAAPAAPYTITAMVSAVSPAYNFAGFGIGFTDGTKVQMIANGFNNGSVLRILNFTSPTVFGSDATNSQFWGFSINTLWYQIADDGTSVYFRQSADGVNFNNVYSVTKSTGFLGAAGYTNVGFFLDVEGTAQAGTAQNSSITLQSWKQV